MPMPAAEIERLIKTALPDAVVELTPLADDGDHWAATVTSPAFKGLSRVRQHQLVQSAFGEDSRDGAARAGADHRYALKNKRAA